MILRAKYLVPVDAPVIESAALEVTDGIITGVAPAHEFPRRSSTDFGDAVILPAFVNAHTHLELSHLRGLVPPDRDFTGWLKRLMGKLGDAPPTRENVTAALHEGIEESITQGVLTVGDITRQPLWTREVLAHAPVRSVSFGELIAIGNRRDRLAERMDAATMGGSQTVTQGSDRFRIGISPHAPYTVEPDALLACAQRAKQLGLPTTIHLLETADEVDFTQFGRGALADYLRAIGVWDDRVPVSRCTPVELLERTGILAPDTVLAHVNYATDDDITRIARSGASVVYCPRTHAAFGHKPHRFRKMLKAGINVCIGTDSLASNPSLSVLDELRFLHALDPSLPADELISMGTSRGSRALGWTPLSSTLRVGEEANFVIVQLDRETKSEGWASMLRSSLPPVAVYFRGALLFSRHG